MASTLAVDKISPQAAAVVTEFHPDIVAEVAATVARDRVVVVGMKQNPVVKDARKLLKEAGITFTYLEYGSYTSKWRKRLAIKLWAHFPTFPMIFIDGTLVGGLDQLRERQSAGTLL